MKYKEVTVEILRIYGEKEKIVLPVVNYAVALFIISACKSEMIPKNNMQVLLFPKEVIDGMIEFIRNLETELDRKTEEIESRDTT